MLRDNAIDEQENAPKLANGCFFKITVTLANWVIFGVRHSGVEMNLSEFVVQPRGPYLFDWYRHRTPIPSPIGPFDIELQVKDSQQRAPDTRMLDAVSKLSHAFIRDVELIAERVLNEYRRVSEDIAWQETYPVQQIKSYRGLQRHLRSRC